MKIKSQRDFWAGLMFIVVGVAFAWGATNYSFGAAARPGPGYFPFGLGIILAVLGAIVVFIALTVESEGGAHVGAFVWKPIFIIIGAILLFGWMLPRMGIIISLPILVILASMAGDEFHWGEAILNAAVLTAASWLIFIVGLNLTIPMWPAFLAPGT